MGIIYDLIYKKHDKKIRKEVLEELKETAKEEIRKEFLEELKETKKRKLKKK